MICCGTVLLPKLCEFPLVVYTIGASSSALCLQAGGVAQLAVVMAIICGQLMMICSQLAILCGLWCRRLCADELGPRPNLAFGIS